MNASKVRPPLDGFEGRLEADLVKIVTARAAAPPGPQRPVATQPAAGTRVLAGLAAGTAIAAATGLALGVTALGNPPAARPAAGLSTGAGSVHIHTAAFSVDSYTDGTLHVTWDKKQYIRDHAGLQQALRGAGFPVLIREGVFCKGPHDNGHLNPSGAGPGVGQVMKGQRHGGTVVFVFTPSAMPAGKELFIGYLTPSQLALTHGKPGSVERLVSTGVPLTCTTQPPPSHWGQTSPVKQRG
jgi:hypothetical protein